MSFSRPTIGKRISFSVGSNPVDFSKFIIFLMDSKLDLEERKVWNWFFQVRPVRSLQFLGLIKIAGEPGHIKTVGKTLHIR